MPLPRAVQEQADRAEAAHLALLGNTGTPPAPVAPVVPPVVPVVEVVPVPAPVAPAPTPVEQPVVAPDSWELKYRVLSGKFNAEVPRLAAQVRELTEQLRTQATPAPAPVVDPNAVTPDSVRSQYGDDFASAVDAIASARVQAVRDEFGSQVEEVQARTSQRDRADFLRDLGTMVPSWRDIDRNPGFTAYLDEFDAQTGRTRREFFNEADSSNNAARIASFFASFERSTNPPAPAPAPVVPPVAPAAPPSVDHLISPSSSRASEAPPGKKYWTRAEIGQFYRDAKAGQGRPFGSFTAEQFTRIDSDISAAAGENRIGA